MTGSVLPPEVEAEISRLKRRVTDLERRLERKAPDVPRWIPVFSLPGGLFVAHSGRWQHPTGGKLVALAATLVTPGASTTIVEARKNGVALDPKLKITTGNTEGRTQIPEVAFSPMYDKLELAVTTAGAGAEDLVVMAFFDR